MELGELKALDFDVSLTGFELSDFNLEDGSELLKDDFDVEAELPEEPKSKLGEVYQLGNHRLMCGDAMWNCAGAESSNATNDNQAITIEVSNSGGAPNWPVSNAAWNSLVNLCVDICRRYNFRLTYNGTPNGSLTRHNMYVATACPGSTLQGRLPELARLVNARLDGASSQKTCTVVKGDSLWKIAQKQMGDGTKWPQIQSLNNLKSTTIFPGQVLKIPS